MFWELWHAPSANAIAIFETEAEVVLAVRELISVGWKADEILVMYDDPALTDEDLPPAISGEELLRRAEAAAKSSPTRRTA